MDWIEEPRLAVFQARASLLMFRAVRYSVRANPTKRSHAMTYGVDLRERGLRLLAKLHGGHAGEAMVAEMRDICPDFADMSVEWALGGVLARPGLDLVTRELVLVASCVTMGHAMPQLRAHAEAAREAGATKEQIVETVLQLVFYAGGPAVRNSLVALQDLFAKAPVTEQEAIDGAKR
jgi:4-carboxymuconolactone decarboxylase